MKRIYFVFGLVFSLFLITVFISPAYAADSVLKTTISLPDGTFPISVAVDSINHKVYVATRTPNKLYIIDSLTDLITADISLAHIPYGVGVDSSSGQVYIANYFDGSVSVFNIASNTITETISGSFENPVAFAVNESTGKVYVTNDPGAAANPGYVTVINSGTNDIEGTVAVGPQPWGIAIDEVTNRVYVSSSTNSPGLSIIDGNTDQVIHTMTVGVALQGIAVDTVLNRIYINSQFDGKLIVIDGSTYAILETINLNSYSLNPVALGVDSEKHKAYVGNLGGSNIGTSVSIVDTQSNTVLQHLSVGPYPIGVGVHAVGIDKLLHKVYTPISSLSSVAVIAEENQTPILNALSNKTMNEGSAYTAPGSFTDPDSISWTATVDYGDGTGEYDLILNTDKTFSLNHVYTVPGTFTVLVTITDDQGASDTASATITVYPVPTNKDQCKKDGWKNYPNLLFKNQGDCVSFVATHGKNPPNG